MSEALSQTQYKFETVILNALFIGLAEKRVRYAVLRNYDSLPESVGARDIDIVVHPDDLSDACSVIASIIKGRSLRLANYFSDERLTQFALVGRDHAGGLLQIKIDFFTRSEAYGVEFLSANDILRDVRDHNGVTVVSDPVMLLDKWIFHLLVGQPLDPKYDCSFATIARAEGPKLAHGLGSFLPKARATTLVRALAEGKGSTLVLSGTERRRALARLWFSQGPTAVPRSLRFAAFRLRDLLRPSGIFLSVSGPDGAGKTTVIDMVVAELGAIYGESAIHCSHFRPSALPRIAEVARRTRAVAEVDVDYDRPHRGRPSGMAGSVLRLGYYWADYLIGYFRTVRPALKRREVMLFDRYYYDMIADSLRSRISLPMLLLRLAGRFLPLPKYAFFISVKSDEIHRRKQELALDRIVELNDRYEELARHGWLAAIENNGAPEDAAAAITEHIVYDRHAQAIRELT